jgi:hypothetical protein
VTEKPYAGAIRKTYRWRIPEEGPFCFPANLTEMGVGEEGRCLRRMVFNPPVTVLSDEHIEIDPDGRQWLCNPDGRKRELKGHWERVNEPME